MKDFLEIKSDRLSFNYGSDTLGITFHRTQRVADDNKKHGLPPSLGVFPLEHVEDHRVPAQWADRGGVFFPMHQAEAMWMSFNSRRPYAIKIAAGKINAISGRPWEAELSRSKKDYCVAPKQPWLDGFNVGNDVVRQFVAAPLGEGYTVEEQLTGEAYWGGLQIIVYPMKDSEWEAYQRKQNSVNVMGAMRSINHIGASLLASNSAQSSMGMAAGGVIHQTIYEDTMPFDVWDTSRGLRVFAHICNAEHYPHITGKKAPEMQKSVQYYEKYVNPYNPTVLEQYSQYSKDIPASPELSKIQSVGQIAVQKGDSFFKKKITGGNW